MSLLYMKSPSSNSTCLPIQFDILWRLFEFRELITYPANRRALKQWERQHPDGLPDVAAAVFAQLHLRNPAPELLKQALTYCVRMVEERGYHPTAPHALLHDPVPDARHYVLVPGCQGPEVLESRAKATYWLLSRLQQESYSVVFSGANPVGAGTGLKVQTPDEALALEAAFLRLADDDRAFSTRFTTARESQSSKTDENIRNFFTGRYLDKQAPAVLYLVTSTFHLPKLLDLAEAQLKEDQRVLRIVAVPAEASLENSPVVQTAPYVKWMMFTIFQHLLKYSNRHLWADGEVTG